MRELVEQLGKIAAGPLLKQYCGDKKMNLQQGYALGQILKGVFQGQAQVLLVERAAELAGQGFAEFAVNHFQRNRECVSGAHRAGDELQAVRELLFKLLHAGPTLVNHVKKRRAESQDAGGPGELVERGREHVPEHEEGRQERKHRHLHQLGGSPAQAGPLDQRLYALGEFQIRQKFLRERRRGLVTLDQSRSFGLLFFGFLCLGFAEKAVFDALYIRLGGFAHRQVDQDGPNNDQQEQKNRIPEHKSSLNIHHLVEDVGWEADTCGQQLLVKLGPDACGRETAKHPTLRRDSAFFKHE